MIKTREQRLKEIEYMFPVERIDYVKPDILRDGASPVGESPKGYRNVVLYAVIILSGFVLLALFHYLGWIETAKYGG